MKLEKFSKYLRKNNIELKDDGERAVHKNGKWAIGDGDWVNRTIVGENIIEVIEELEDFSDILECPFNIPPSIKELLEVCSNIESIANGIAFDICEHMDMKYVSYYDDNAFVIDFFWEI